MSVLDSKREWRALQARVQALPADYQIVYRAVQKYWFKVTAITPATLTTTAFEDLVALLEAGAARQADVLAITGADVAEFADGFLGSV